ncbi:MAG: Gfo/Idh/MocA family oxidoreductase [Erysipelotrichaceae bacterium]|nr:Gfo/Idh/MocA family oxidoreductase [Erysipelotrichaceae bacterium]
MNWGIIGFGRIARKFVESSRYLKDHKIVAIGSKSLSKDDPLFIENSQVKIYQDYNELLEDENIDAVYIALPHKFHYEWVIKALNHHKAVLCEKPAVLSKNEMLAIKEAALKNQTFFLEALKTKMNVGLFHLKKDLPLIGNIKSVEANFCSNCLSLRGTDIFLYDPKQGGALNDVGTYLLGFVLSIIHSPIKMISATSKMYGEFDEHFNAQLFFENGAIANIEGAIDENKERYAKIIGEQGEIYIPMFNRMSEYTVSLNNGKVFTCEYPIYGTDMTYQIQELYDCVKQNKIESDLHSLDETIEIIEIVEKIRNRLKEVQE